MVLPTRKARESVPTVRRATPGGKVIAYSIFKKACWVLMFL